MEELFFSVALTNQGELFLLIEIVNVPLTELDIFATKPFLTGPIAISLSAFRVELSAAMYEKSVGAPKLEE